MEHYDSVRNMASDIHAYAPDARVLTTYYCGILLPLFIYLGAVLYFCFLSSLDACTNKMHICSSSIISFIGSCSESKLFVISF